MAKVTAPALSMGGSGQIGKTMVYGSWRGVNYVRQHVVPNNPKSAAQQQTRGVFAWASSTWKSSGALFRAAWTAYSKGKPLTDRNAFIGSNTKAMRSETVLTTMVFSPGSGGGLSPVSVASTPGAGTLELTTTNPDAPTGWTISSMVAFAVLQGDPHTIGYSTVYEEQDSATFNTVTFNGLKAGTYVYGAILVWTKPDGSTAYSVAETGTAVVN